MFSNKITARETQILLNLAEGRTPNEIERKIGGDPVRVVIKTIGDKLSRGTESRTIVEGTFDYYKASAYAQKSPTYIKSLVERYNKACEADNEEAYWNIRAGKTLELEQAKHSLPSIGVRLNIFSKLINIDMCVDENVITRVDALEIQNVGCLIKTSTTVNNDCGICVNTSEAVSFLPKVHIEKMSSGNLIVVAD